MNDMANTPDVLLAKAFSAYVGIWADERDVDEKTREWLTCLAYQLSMAVSEGHACLLSEDMVFLKTWPSLEEMRPLLVESGLVGTVENPGNSPMVLDHEGRLYLHRYFEYECVLAERLLAMQASGYAFSDRMRERLETFFGQVSPDEDVNWQRLAAALALFNRLTIISGGPGTGKTTTVATILACLLEENPQMRIVLAAPTGKAAMRMLEAIRERLAFFPPDLQARMPSEAYTLHRLLGVTSREGVFRHHFRNPLLLDVLVVDEASMIDLAMAARLLDALPPHARLIMLGDKDQLSAVEAGAVFSDLSADPSLPEECLSFLSDASGIAKEKIRIAGTYESTPLTGSTVWLKRNYRFSMDSGIGNLALAIREGNVPDVLGILSNQDDGSTGWIKTQAGSLAEDVVSRIREGYSVFLDCVRKTPKDYDAVFAAFERFRVLCAVREGSSGVTAVNDLMSGYLLSRLSDGGAWRSWYPGRPVMVRKNDYALNLFNGDIGITLPDDSGALMVFFQSEKRGYRAISPARLPEHETAYAMTVHKSQGSEFESLLVLLPSLMNRIVTRELLYTAVTRARKSVFLAAPQDVIEEGILTTARKRSGLTDRMRDTGCRKRS